MTQLAWGAKVSQLFRSKVLAISGSLYVDPSWLMACMAFETGETFSPSIANGAGSGAVGLIQFMPSTAFLLQTTTSDLIKMSAVDQLFYVEKYFHNRAGKLHSLGDVYGAILWPSMIGQPDTFVVFDQKDPDHPKRYLQNKGLDFNHDGLITRGEVVSIVQKKLDKGLLAGNSITV